MRPNFSRSVHISAVVFILVIGIFAASGANAAITREQKVFESLYKLSEVRSWVYDGFLSYYGKAGTRYSDMLVGPAVKKTPAVYQTFTVNFKGGKEIFTPTDYQSWFSLSTKSSDKKEIVFGLDTKYVGRNFYIALNKLENMPLELAEYKDVWVQFNLNSILQELGVDKSLLDKAYEVKKSDEEELDELKGILAKSKAFRVTGAYSARLGADRFTVYNFTISKNGLKKLLADTEKVSGPLLTARQAANFNEGLSEIKSIYGNVWISKKDSLPYRINMNVLGTKPREKTSFALNFKNFNQPVPVSEPEAYINWRELLEKILPSSLMSTTTPTTTAPLW